MRLTSGPFHSVRQGQALLPGTPHGDDQSVFRQRLGAGDSDGVREGRVRVCRQGESSRDEMVIYVSVCLFPAVADPAVGFGVGTDQVAEGSFSYVVSH